jgi:hypothetical protein
LPLEETTLTCSPQHLPLLIASDDIENSCSAISMLPTAVVSEVSLNFPWKNTSDVFNVVFS